MTHTIERGLPSSVYAEKLVLGSIVVNNRHFFDAVSLQPEDWTLESHRAIWRRMRDLFEAGQSINRVTLYDELNRHGEAELVGGLSYLVDLDVDLPDLPDVTSYVRLVLEKSRLRQIIYIAEAAQQQAFIAEETPEAIIGGLLEAVQDIGKDLSGKGLTTPAEIIRGELGGLDGILTPQRGGFSVPTGFHDLDDVLGGGVEPGQLILLAARPSVGKTAAMLNIARNMILADKPHTAAIFSLEMRRSALIRRMIASLARVDLQKLRTGFLDDGDKARLLEAAATIHDAPLWIDDASSTTLLDVRAKVQRLQAMLRRTGAPPLGLVAIDYLQLMPILGSRKSATREQDVSALSRGLKLIAKEAEVCVLALCQLSRRVDERVNHEPQLSDLRESGSLEQDADAVLLLYRAQVYYPDREDLRGQAELIVAKQREGPTGKVHLSWLAELTQFEERGWR